MNDIFVLSNSLQDNELERKKNVFFFFLKRHVILSHYYFHKHTSNEQCEKLK